MKKIIFFIILFIMPFCVFAKNNNSTIVMDIDSGRVLYQSNAVQKKLIASTTKIMTCIIVLENFDINNELVVGDEVLSMYGTNIYIEPGEKIKIIDLLYGLMLRSGNDAAITLAYNTFGEEKFIKEMNEKAKKLGMYNTVFANPHGLDDDTENYSTAYDMALLSKYAYNNPIYRKIISTKKYVTKSSLKKYVWYNRMSLLSKYNNCIGGKNGYTPRAGKSLVSYAKKDDVVLTIVSLNDSDIYENHSALYEKIFKEYKNYKIIDNKDIIIDGYYAKNSFKYPLTKDELDDVFTLVKIDSIGNTGEIDINLKKQRIGNVKLYKNEKIKKEKKSLFKQIADLFCRYSKKVY